MFEPDLLDAIPNRVPDPHNVTKFLYTEDVSDPKSRLRKILVVWADNGKLFSLDEYLSVVVILSTIIFGLASYMTDLLSWKITLACLSGILTVMFWASYKVAKALHAIEFRLAIISSFVPFMIMSFIPIAGLGLSGVLHDLVNFLLMLIVLPLWFALFNLNLMKKLPKRIWAWIAREPPRMPSSIHGGEDELRRAVASAAAFLYAEAATYGASVVCLLISISLTLQGLEYLLYVVVILAMAFLLFWLTIKGARESCYQAELDDVAYQKYSLIARGIIENKKE